MRAGMIAILIAIVAPMVSALAQSDSTQNSDRINVTSERARIARERADALSRQAQEEAACRQQFIVNDCLNESRRRWREVLADLRRQDITLSDSQRKQRSAERLQQVEERSSPQALEQAARRREQALKDQDERLERAAEKATAPRPTGTPRAPVGERPQALPAGTPRDSDTHSSRDALSADEKVANTRARAQREQEALEHKQNLQKRQAQRSKPAASALAVPP